MTITWQMILALALIVGGATSVRLMLKGCPGPCEENL